MASLRIGHPQVSGQTGVEQTPTEMNAARPQGHDTEFRETLKTC